MSFIRGPFFYLLLAVFFWLMNIAAPAQTLTITNGVQTYTNLVSMTVAMSNLSATVLSDHFRAVNRPAR